MKSLEELHNLREQAKENLKTRQTEDKPQIIIGMGTCGIAAGAREIMQVILSEIDSRGLDVVVKQTGCIGMCEQEPLVDVKLQKGERITYGNVTPEAAKKIVASHIVNGNLVSDLVVGKITD